ncbi:nucleotidyltransferase [Mesorhizobium sp. ES1-1]|uniref:nucleotidyltransferase domain-containing protein n=1 Tax=Mesorhizobium sp. ES1-1 TaxID=2876629 RepID=UPI001CC94720|nr:nucleotidyltransferase [Mesorhizobium sp. ES1-1]MBZ9678248.1 nucleotidyltransferase [Mesorhizobium sp. ES1-1]
MAISEAQLATWSAQGSITQSATTYQAIRGVLNDTGSPYYAKIFEIFLQGSYGNATNIYADSDVDVVIKLTSTYYPDTSRLNSAEKAQYDRDWTPASYELSEFKRDVAAWLTYKFGNGVKVGNKAIFVPGNGSRRDADVLVAAEHRLYTGWPGYVEGIVFEAGSGRRIVNYPKQHSENCTAKHQATDGRFKPMVRVLKNMRNKMKSDRYLADGVAPSYYLEGLLYNAPNSCFGASFQNTYELSMAYLLTAHRDQLMCANNIHYLVRDGYDTSWSDANFVAYMNAADAFWRNH